MTTEHDIQSNIQVALSKRGHTVFRINVGKVRTADGRWFDTGTPRGFSDLCGFRKGDARMFFVEVKNEKGRVRDDQKTFLNTVTRKGALGGVARSVEDAIAIVEEEEYCGIR